MRISTRSLVLSGLIFLSGSAFGAGKPNFDALGARPPAPASAAALQQKAGLAVSAGARLQVESRLGVPTFLWVAGSPGASLAASRSRLTPGKSSQEAAARAALSQFASLYGLEAQDVNGAVVAMVHDTGKGPIVVKFRQQVNGIDVFREEINVVMNRGLEAVAISGYIAGASTPAAQGGSMSFALGATSAALGAVSDFAGAGVAGPLVSAGSRGGYDTYTLPSAPGAVLDEPVRVKKVYFHLPEGFEAGYYVEVIGRSPDDSVASVDGTATSTEGYSYVISAVNGSILFRKNLSADDKAAGAARRANVLSPFTYRVWADPATMIPYDTPAGNAVHPKTNPAPDGFQAPFLPSNDVTLQNFPFSQNDPWLAPGATETVGNNADAFVNLFNPDGYGPTAPPADPATGDFRAQITSAGQFLHTAVADAEPKLAEARQADIQQLFYDVNFLHDWYYDSGFDEASGNAQVNNFGRGGLGGDDIKAQAQDVSGRNNANMLTPADGSRPRMRMYLFDSNAIKYVDVLSPASAAGQRAVGTGQFGQQVFDVTNSLVQPSPAHGCTAASFTGTAGKFVMVDREPTATCSIGTKLNNAMAAGAAGFILVNLSTTPDTLVNVTGSLPTFTIPFLTITWNGAASIKTALAVPTAVTARMRRDAGIDRDGTIDNQIVFHEWAHYLSNRLVGNANGLVSNQSGGMGEGWGDFNAMMLTARADDAATPSNATYNGVYALATYATSGGVNDGYYFGIRRYPYSTDMTKNPLTFHHIQNGIPLPGGPPVAFGADGSNNAEVHNTGEVWTTMLWECYASLLRDTQGPTPRLTFQQAQDRMKGYLVASLKATPIAPTFTEARDAVLAAAYATDVTDYVEFQQAFAKRGAGVGAISPDRFSTTNSTVTESFATGPGLAFQSLAIDDGSSSCDADGILDSGETGFLRITLLNAGTTTLTGTTATISSSTPGVSFPLGTTVLLQPSAPTTTTTGTLSIALAPGLVGIQQLDFQIDYNDPQLGGPPLTATVILRGNTNEIPASTATDDVEALGTIWSVSSNPAFGAVAPWARKAISGVQHVWHGTDANAGSDEYLVSPVFTVNGGGSFNLQFDHSWSFEFDGGGNYDGGVVEMSVNGGAFTDIGAPAYNGTILNYAGDVNPLKGRPGFVQNSAGTVHTSLTQAIAPGSTVQVRFRIGTDSAGNAAGWDVDNIAFSGVVETPFTALVADPGCSLPTMTNLFVPDNPSPFGSPLFISASVSVLGGPAVGGSVTFYDGASTIGSAPLASGSASMTTSSLSQGVHTLKAQYSGATGFASSTSNVVSETIGKPATTTLVGSSANPSALGQSVTFTATVSALSGTPTGSVTFTDFATPLATVALSGGVATFTTSTLYGGSHTVNATYAGNATFAASTGSAFQDVAVPTVSASGPTTFCQGGSVTLTASIAPGPGVSYLWSPGGATTRSILVTSSGNYAVTVTVNGTPGLSPLTFVTVNPTPSLPVISAPATALTGTTGLVASVTSNPGSTYAWSITNGTITGGTGTNQITFTAGAAGTLGLSVIETNFSGCPSGQATASVTVTALPSVSFMLHTLTPCRVLDTRTATGPSAGAPALAPNELRTIDPAGRCGIPASAKALSVNVTAVGGASAGGVVVYPADINPGVAVGVSVWFRAGRTRAVNGLLVVAHDGSGFKILNVSPSSTGVIVDVNGWFE